ncbi:hypothetical protein G9A89_013661 [Geosiphon pyriformis]|nr:hypothetical protein G9A89_013661 [Geosiphon pyriformis]
METTPLIPEKNKQDLQNLKPTPKASPIPNNLTTPEENNKIEPKTKTGTKLLCGMSPFFSMKAQCLAWTSQISFRKERQNACMKSTMTEVAILESLKTETDSQNQPLKTKPLHKAVPTAASTTQVDSNCETHEKDRTKPKHTSQANA